MHHPPGKRRHDCRLQQCQEVKSNVRIVCHLLALLQMTGNASGLLSPTQVDLPITLSYCNSLVYIPVARSPCLNTYKLISRQKNKQV